jgi:predicted Rossmann-fold nucleotide-binding protein
MRVLTMNGEDRDLGMGRAIARRDFLQGVAVTGAAGSMLAGAAGTARAAQRTVAGLNVDGPVSAANYPHAYRHAWPPSRSL